MNKIIRILFLIIAISFLVLFFQNEKKVVNNQPDDQIETKQEENDECVNNSYFGCKDYPKYDFPLKYFSVRDVTWGSLGGDGKEGTMEAYSQVALDGKEIYQSYPTAETKISEYSSEVIPISTKKLSEIKKEIIETEGEDSFWLKELDKQYKEYGQVAVHFWDEFLDIEMFDTFDVDGDGIDEKILGLNFVGRANGGSYTAAIVKGNNIIFSVEQDNSYIIKNETGNGFYVEWRNPDDGSARCCETGYLRTRFVYEDGKFVPIYEQEIRYFLVGKTDN